jgi:hypothetical protein
LGILDECHGYTCILTPFFALTGHRPNSTTQIPGRDIDYVLTSGITIDSISTIPINTPAKSDHLGIILDINLAGHFNSTFSEIHSMPPRSLTSGNKSSVDAYLSYVHKQIDIHNISDRVDKLFTITQGSLFDCTEVTRQLNTIDMQLTEILLAGEKQCSKINICIKTGNLNHNSSQGPFHIGSRRNLWYKKK